MCLFCHIFGWASAPNPQPPPCTSLPPSMERVAQRVATPSWRIRLCPMGIVRGWPANTFAVAARDSKSRGSLMARLLQTAPENLSPSGIRSGETSPRSAIWGRIPYAFIFRRRCGYWTKPDNMTCSFSLMFHGKSTVAFSKTGRPWNAHGLKSAPRPEIWATIRQCSPSAWPTNFQWTWCASMADARSNDLLRNY